MQNCIVCIGLLVTLVSSAAAKTLPLPSYITPCSRNEPDLNACFVKRGNEAIPKIVGGDKKYKIPVLDPLVINRLHVDAGVLGVNFTATNLKIEGLRDAIIRRVDLNFKENVITYDILMPTLTLHSDYEIGGRILILPIQGAGTGNITLSNATVVYTFDFEFVKKDGDVYTIPTTSKLVFDAGRLHIHLDNLFNGNKLLGDEMNRFLNENWRELIKELGPVVGQAMGEVLGDIQKNVFELVSYDTSLPDIPV